MDPSRFGLQQGWENNSALEGYTGVEGSDIRDGGSYGDRRYVDGGYPRDNIYPRGTFQRDMLERDNYHPPHAVRNWPQMRRRTYEEDYSQARDSRRIVDNYCDADVSREYGYNRPGRFEGRERSDYGSDEYEYRRRGSHQNREDSRERDCDFSRYDYDSDCERGRRDFKDSGWRRRESHDREHDKRGLSREKESSPYRRQHERSRSHGRDDRPRSRSPRSRSYSRGYREDSYEDSRYDSGDRKRDRDEKHYSDRSSVAPSATLVVKGLSQKTTEEDLYQILSEWGPLRHVRVIKERNSGASRGFAFIDFPSVAAAQNMLDGIGVEGLVVDGRKVLFEYSSRPTGGSGGPFFGQDIGTKTGHGHSRNSSLFDWMCTLCGYVNFARRTSCFQCNEVRAEDAPAADVTTSNSATSGKRGSDAGPTHVLVVRGLDENADEDMIRYEFSKHAPIKDLRLVRDKFTHVSRGFGFVHFHSVEDATKALEATNGTTLERNGQVLRVAYAKSIHGPGPSGTSQSSSVAAAAIEAATFSQQYDAVGWAPKEYNPDDKQSNGVTNQGNNENAQKGGSALQSGFVWDEASGYYYDAASGYYYDGNTGLYYDGNNGIWYSYDHQTQQYIPCNNEHDNASNGKSANESAKTADGMSSKKVVISAPATIASNDKKSLPDAVQAAAAAALAAEKRDKEKQKEIRLASKSSILANKKKMNNVLNMWKQRNHEGQSARAVLDINQATSLTDDKTGGSSNLITGMAARNKVKPDIPKENTSSSSVDMDSQAKARPLMGVIRGSGRGVVKSDTVYSGTSIAGDSSFANTSASGPESQGVLTPFRTDASALGSYTPVAAGSGKRRFSETPQQAINACEPPQATTAYRDRAAERRSLYGSSSSTAGDDFSDIGEPNFGEPKWEMSSRKGVDAGAMPFPPGVGGQSEVSSVQDYDVITTDKAIDENNVGNRMLRNMGWQEGLGLGKDGSGITAPVLAQSVDTRAGLGSQQRKAVDPSLEVQAGDSYRTLIQKKALARFREMS